MSISSFSVRSRKRQRNRWPQLRLPVGAVTTAPLPPAGTGHREAPLRGSPQGEDLRSVYAVCTVCKLIFLLAAIKIKDLGICGKRYYQLYVLAFLSYDQGINPAFSARL